MTDKRKANQRVKQIVIEITGDINARVKSGRGTAYNWWYITAKSNNEQQVEVEKRLSDEKLVGHYYGDYGVNDKGEACVAWQ